VVVAWRRAPIPYGSRGDDTGRKARSKRGRKGRESCSPEVSVIPVVGDEGYLVVQSA